MKKSEGVTNNFQQQTGQEEIYHRHLVKEVTKLLNKDDSGIKTLEEDPELIMMLEADLLLESKDEESYDIAKAFGKVFIDRPQKFPDQSLISMNAKMFTEKKKKKVKKEKKEKKEEPKPEEQ